MKKEDLKVFKNDEFGKIRVIMNNGVPMFSAIDVAKSLGYSDSDKAIRTHCKKSNNIFVLHGDGKPGGTSMKFIPESDIFRLIMSSKLSEAEKFQDWVFEEVLPSIRETGMYATDKKIDEFIKDPDSFFKLVEKWKEERGLRLEVEEKLSEATLKLESQKDIVDYTNEFLRIEDSDKLTTQISKEYGLSALKMNEILCGLNIQFWKGGQYHLYAKYDGKGYANNRKYSSWNPITKSKDVSQCLVWTEKGRKFIYDLFKKGKFNKFLSKKELEEMYLAVESLKTSSIYEK